jgi:hypothetical protein
MKTFGIVSYNIHSNFTNYGSALQSWALNQMVGRLGYKPVLMDYCPDVLRDANPLDPFKKMWDKDAESRRMCELTMPAIRENFKKFDRFYTERFNRSKGVYTAENFSDCIGREGLDGFICGSDTIFCIDEFKGFDDGYYANYPCMKGRSVAYAASFGDSHFTEADYQTLNGRLSNFTAIALRENEMLDYVKAHATAPVARVIDPTLLLTSEDYDGLAIESPCKEPYLLLYTRRYNPKMEAFAIQYAREHGLKVVEISLRATNAELGHEMRYDAGVEEFLGLVKGAQYVVTNSFHGLIFGVQYSRPLAVFSRESGDSKINEVLDLFGMKNRLLVTGHEQLDGEIDYVVVHSRIAEVRARSKAFLAQELEML